MDSQNVGTAIALDAAGNVYVTGHSPGTGSGNDIVTIKYDNNGNEKWVVRYNGPANGDDLATGLVVDADANIYVTGYSATSAGGTEFVTIKYTQENLKLEKQANGIMRLQVTTAPGQIYGLEASTNLQTWLPSPPTPPTRTV